MKSIGIIRKIDELGRVVLPKSIREHMDINERDPMEIYVDGNRIVLQKHQAFCVFCGECEDLIHYHEKCLCPACLKNLKQL